MVEENLEHKGAFVPFLNLCYALLHLEEGSFNFQVFPLYDTTLEEVCVHLAVVCIGKWKVQF
jgi:hypothetical protein